MEKIPAEKRWAITTKTLTNIIVLRGDKSMPPLLGIGEGIIAPVLGLEKYLEINTKIWGDGGRRFLLWVKETFDIPVEDAIGAAKLSIVAGTLQTGSEFKYKIIEATPEKVVVRTKICAWMERYKENKIEPEFIPCATACQAYFKEGFKTINPKITFKHTKIMPWRDPYCEWLIKFEEEEISR